MFAALCPARGLPVFTVGAATAAAARTLDFTDVRSANGAVTDLAELLARSAPRGGRVLAPGAREAAGDLAGLLHGVVDVRSLAVYEAVETGIRAPVDFDAVLVHSPRAARAVGPALGPGGGRGRVAIAISETAARALPSAGFVTVAIATRPSDEGVLEALGKAAPAV